MRIEFTDEDERPTLIARLGLPAEVTDEQIANTVIDRLTRETPGQSARRRYKEAHVPAPPVDPVECERVIAAAVEAGKFPERASSTTDTVGHVIQTAPRV